MKNYLLFFISLIAYQFISAQKTDKKLNAKLLEAINGFNGDIGIYVKNLRTGKTVSINVDTVFPTASIVKVPILLGVMDKIEKKELGYDQPVEYKDSLLYEGEDILGRLKAAKRFC